jgi:transcriptional regulator with XRE-family HTH domain
LRSTVRFGIHDGEQGGDLMTNDAKIDQREMGSRIRQAREACGLTQEQVATHLGLKRPVVSLIESGERAVSLSELEKLSYFFGRRPYDLMGEAFVSRSPIGDLLRAHLGSGAENEVSRAVMRAMQLGHELANLEEKLGKATAGVPKYDVGAPDSRFEAVRQGREVAEFERRRLGLGELPVPELVEVLEAQGVKVGFVELPEEVLGIALQPRDEGSFLFADASRSLARVRFSLAHGLGHVLMDGRIEGVVCRAADREKILEIRANAFAAAFLMPEGGLRAFLSTIGKGQPSRIYEQVFDGQEAVPVEGRTAPGSQDLQAWDLVRMTKAFGVGERDLLHRLQSLRLIDKKELEELEKQERALGPVVREALEIEEPAGEEIHAAWRERVVSRLFEAYVREVFSQGKILEVGKLVGADLKALKKVFQTLDDEP